MKKLEFNVIAIVVLLFAISGLQAQECEFFVPSKVGSKLKYENFDKKDKLTGSTVQTVIANNVIDGVQTVKLRNEYYAPDTDTAFVRELSFKCINGEFVVDMQSYISENTLTPYSGMETKIDVDNLSIPAKMSVGQVLGNGKVDLTVFNNGMKLITISVNVKNRKVEAIEDITTPAGTFEAYKITYDLETKMLFTIKSKSAEWYVNDIGAVRTETYNKKGKLTSYTVLTEYKK